jgi:hypothetical protein
MRLTESDVTNRFSRFHCQNADDFLWFSVVLVGLMGFDIDVEENVVGDTVTRTVTLPEVKGNHITVTMRRIGQKTMYSGGHYIRIPLPDCEGTSGAFDNADRETMFARMMSHLPQLNHTASMIAHHKKNGLL